MQFINRYCVYVRKSGTIVVVLNNNIVINDIVVDMRRVHNEEKMFC